MDIKVGTYESKYPGDPVEVYYINDSLKRPIHYKTLKAGSQHSCTKGYFMTYYRTDPETCNGKIVEIEGIRYKLVEV